MYFKIKTKGSPENDFVFPGSQIQIAKYLFTISAGANAHPFAGKEY